MKAYVIDKDIGLPDLAGRLVETEEPVADGDLGEVLVDIHSSALNFFDILQIQGKYQVKRPFPYILGTEIAGIISKDSPIPEGCDWIPGKTRVFGMANGSYAEKAMADWMNLREVPDGISLEEASGLFITWPTSYAALKFRANVQPGEWVLVHAGAGGVGICAIQIAKALGAKVIATAGSKDKLEICKKVGGADEAVNYRDGNWQQQVKGAL
jgi:NADPH2:quinone reductase